MVFVDVRIPSSSHQQPHTLNYVVLTEQKLIHLPNLTTDIVRPVPPGAERPLQVTARVQRLGPDLLLHVPAAEPGQHVLARAPHALAPDPVVEDVVHPRRVGFVDVCVEEGGAC